MFRFCSCPSGNKSLLLVARNNPLMLPDACPNIGTGRQLATELESQDYKALGICLPPEIEQYYSIGLNLPNESNRNCSESHPYNWNPGNGENVRRCVNGQPLILPNSFPNDTRCHLASIKPGSLDFIYDANLTRCNSLQYYICQVEAVNSNATRCENVSKTTIETKQISDSMSNTTVTTSATAITSNNSTAIIVGSVLGVSVVLLFLLLLVIFCKRVKRKRNPSNNKNPEVVYYNIEPDHQPHKRNNPDVSSPHESPPSDLEEYDFVQDGAPDPNLYAVVQKHQRQGMVNPDQPNEYQQFEEMTSSSVVDSTQYYAEINKSKNLANAEEYDKINLPM